MKKQLVICIVGAFLLILTACGGTKDTESKGGVLADSGEGQSEQTASSQSSSTKKEQEVENTEEKEIAKLPSEEIPATEEEIVFAEKIKAAVGAKNLEALSELVYYPITVNYQDGTGIEVDNKEEFMKLEIDKIFSEKLLTVIKEVDTSLLFMTEVGVVMGEGVPSITFEPLKEGGYGITYIMQ